MRHYTKEDGLLPRIAPPERRSDQFNEEAKKTLERAFAELGDLEVKIKDMPMSKSKEKQLLDGIDNVRRAMDGSLKFVMDQHLDVKHLRAGHDDWLKKNYRVVQCLDCDKRFERYDA